MVNVNSLDAMELVSAYWDNLVNSVNKVICVLTITQYYVTEFSDDINYNASVRVVKPCSLVTSVRNVPSASYTSKYCVQLCVKVEWHLVRVSARKSFYFRLHLNLVMVVSISRKAFILTFIM